MDEDALKPIREAMMSSVKVPSGAQKVIKSECLYSFDTALSEDGLYTSLLTFRSVGAEHLELYTEKTGSRIYLHHKKTRRRKAESGPGVNGAGDDAADPDDAVMTAASTGGVQLNVKDSLFDDTDSYRIFLMPQRVSLAFPHEELPELIRLSAEAVLKAVEVDGSAAFGSADWVEERTVSKYAKDLPQVENGKLIGPDPTKWICEESGSTENLWLNLSDGFIGSGRQNWDGTGGTGAALRHYEATGKKYPLCVKLGTITPRGADVFSYAEDENDMVIDPYLKEHLARWGIKMQDMEQTEKTMAEMEVELNQSYEFSHILEEGSALQMVTGPGMIGLENLGNSCYMNSVLQVLYAVPELRAKYVDRAPSLLRTTGESPEEDTVTQFAKLGTALHSDRYRDQSVDDKDLEGLFVRVRPRMFKNLIGRNHVEFSTGRQQDAMEFFLHLVDRLEAAERKDRHRFRGEEAMEGALPPPPPASTGSLFRFEVEQRLEDVQSGQVKYTHHTESVLSLMVPVDTAVNKELVQEYEAREQKRQKLREEGVASDEAEDPVKLKIPFAACLDAYVLPRTIADFTSPVTHAKGLAKQTVRFRTFPPYLVVQMMRFLQAEDWTPRKLDALVEVPDRLDLERLRGTGLQEGETPMEEDGEAAAAAAAVDPREEEVVSQLVSMGFSENASRRAFSTTGASDAQTSMNWLLEHLDDPDINDPLPASNSCGNGAADAEKASAVDPEKAAMLQGMGFTARQAEAALACNQGDVERAGEWLISKMENLDAAVDEVLERNAMQAQDANSEDTMDDGVGKYELVGFVSHMGKSTQVGHYVAHVKKDGRWVLFNDEKVALSAKPPRDLGYLYLFRRVQQ